MFAEPTIDDFVARIEDHIQRSLESARRAVREIENRNNARGSYRGGITVAQIFREVLAEFERGIDGALQRFRHSSRVGKLDSLEMREIFGDHLSVYRDQMKDATKHKTLRGFSSGPGLGRVIDEELSKFDEILDFKLRQFDVGFANAEETPVANMVIVHGNAHNFIAGDGNVAQQGTRDSQLTVNAEDIAAKLALIEKELAKVHLTNSELAEMRGSLDTIKAQLSRPAPSISIVKDAALSLQRTIENAAGGLLAHPLGQAIIALATMVGLN